MLSQFPRNYYNTMKFSNFSALIKRCSKSESERSLERSELRKIPNKWHFKVKNDHRSKFSNLSNWKEEA